MPRPKPAWRRWLNARYLRWRAGAAAARRIPGAARWLGFFPIHVGMIEGADEVRANAPRPVPAEEIAPHLDFLRRCAPNDAHSEEIRLPEGVIEGPRTALYRDAWIDMATGSVLLPRGRRTVLVRGAFANWNATSIRPGRHMIATSDRVTAPVPTRNYWHQLLENGLHLIDLAESGTVSDPLPVIVSRPAPTRVERALHDGLANRYGYAVREYPEAVLLEAREAVIHFPANNYWEWPSVTPELAHSLARVFDSVYGTRAAAAGDPGLFLGRAGAKLRTLSNEGALIAALEPRRVVPFTASDANHSEQIARFRAAETVVAIHGAGLTNLLFCRPGTRVVEIFPANFEKSPYWWLCRRLGLDYRPVRGGPGDYHLRFEADIDAVLAALEE